jgi:hypothetical protein
MNQDKDIIEELQVFIDKLKQMNQEPEFRSRELSLAITACEEGRNWLEHCSLNEVSDE